MNLFAQAVPFDSQVHPVAPVRGRGGAPGFERAEPILVGQLAIHDHVGMQRRFLELLGEAGEVAAPGDRDPEAGVLHRLPEEEGAGLLVHRAFHGEKVQPTSRRMDDDFPGHAAAPGGTGNEPSLGQYWPWAIPTTARGCRRAHSTTGTPDCGTSKTSDEKASESSPRRSRCPVFAAAKRETSRS